MQAHIRFNWKAPTTRTDGTPLTAEDIAALDYLLFESGNLIVEGIGELTFSLLMDDEPEGPKSYTVGARQYGLIGPQSEPFLVNFIPPAAPTNLTAEWVAGSDESETESAA